MLSAYKEDEEDDDGEYDDGDFEAATDYKASHKANEKVGSCYLLFYRLTKGLRESSWKKRV